MIHLNKSQTKMLDLSVVKAFDFYPQQTEKGFIPTLRVITQGGDQWWEQDEALELHRMLLTYIEERAKMRERMKWLTDIRDS